MTFGALYLLIFHGAAVLLAAASTQLTFENVPKNFTLERLDKSPKLRDLGGITRTSILKTQDHQIADSRTASKPKITKIGFIKCTLASGKRDAQFSACAALTLLPNFNICVTKHVVVKRIEGESKKDKRQKVCVGEVVAGALTAAILARFVNDAINMGTGPYLKVGFKIFASKEMQNCSCLVYRCLLKLQEYHLSVKNCKD